MWENKKYPAPDQPKRQITEGLWLGTGLKISPPVLLLSAKAPHVRPRRDDATALEVQCLLGLLLLLWDLEPTAMAPMLNALAMMAVAATSAQAFVTSPNAVQLRSPTAPRATATATATDDRSTRHNRCNRRARAAAAARGALRASAEAATYELDEKPLRGPLTPIEDTIMVKVDAPETVTGGGLFLPKMKSVKNTRGTVAAVGEGKRHWDTGVKIPITVEVGERVVYGNYDGTSVEYQGSEHLLMRDTELLMAYEGEEVCVCGEWRWNSLAPCRSWPALLS